MVKQLKNRYNDPTVHKRFVIGIDRSKMKLYDCEQQQLTDSGSEEEVLEIAKTATKFDSFKI